MLLSCSILLQRTIVKSRLNAFSFAFLEVESLVPTHQIFELERCSLPGESPWVQKIYELRPNSCWPVWLHLLLPGLRKPVPEGEDSQMLKVQEDEFSKKKANYQGGVWLDVMATPANQWLKLLPFTCTMEAFSMETPTYQELLQGQDRKLTVHDNKASRFLDNLTTFFRFTLLQQPPLAPQNQ